MENTAQTNPNLKPVTPPSLPQSNSPVSGIPKRNPKTLWYVGGVVVLLFIAGLYFLLQKPQTPSIPAQQPVVQQPTLTPMPTLPSSKAPGVITKVETATALSTKGNAITPTSTFAKTEKTIYLVLSLNNPKIGTKVEYIRYLNGKYLDYSTAKIAKPNSDNISFLWSLKKTGAIHLAGTYKVKTYTNGQFEKEIFYSVQ